MTALFDPRFRTLLTTGRAFRRITISGGESEGSGLFPYYLYIAPQHEALEQAA
jgi:hypothetical protein